MAAVKHNNSEVVSKTTKTYGLFCNAFSSSFLLERGTNEHNESIAKKRITQPN
jgi:hypothetical protein